MSYNFYDEFATPPSPAEQFEQDISALGIRPELLADMSPEDARFVLSGVSKLLTTVTHPDRTGLNTVLGLEAADINAVGARLRSANDHTMEESLEALAQTSTHVAEYAARESLLTANERILARNLQLADALLGPETMKSYSGLIALDFYTAGDAKKLPELQLLELGFTEGNVTQSAVLTSNAAKLASAFGKPAQDFIAEQRPSLDDRPKLVYIDSVTSEKTGLPEYSWCQLVTARGVKNPTSKRAAVKIFDPNSPETYEKDDLLGAELLGKLIYEPPQELHSAAGWPELEQGTQLGQKITYGENPVVRISKQQAKNLLAQGLIEPLENEAELTQAKYLVLFQRSRSKTDKGYSFIVPGLAAVAPAPSRPNPGV